MPILNGRISNFPTSGTTQLEPSEALALHGPSFPGILVQSGQNPSTQKVVEGILLVDTGALATCVDQTAATEAGLQVVDSGPISSATHVDQVVPIYTGIIEFVGTGISINFNRAYGVNLHEQGKIALLGRDILRSSNLIYNGTDGTYSLTM